LKRKNFLIVRFLKLSFCGEEQGKQSEASFYRISDSLLPNPTFPLLPLLSAEYCFLLKTMPAASENTAASGKVLDYRTAEEVLKEYDSRDGLNVQELMDSKVHGGLTYNDFLLLPGYIGFPASEVTLDSPVTKRISLKTPFLSSPMDTVTEHEMAIHIALQGGLGVIHHNCDPDSQADMIRKVKRYENGFILDPVVITRDTTVGDAKSLKEKWGFGGFPVTGQSRIPFLLGCPQSLPEVFNDYKPINQ